MKTSSEVWSFVHLPDGRPDGTALKMASEARRLARLIGGQPCGVTLADVGEDDPTVRELERFGLRKIYCAADASDHGAGPEWAAEAIGALVGAHEPTLLMFPATSVGADIGARVAARLRRGFIANCIDFDWNGEKLTARSSISGGKAHLRATWASAEPYVATMDVASLEAIADHVPDDRIAVVRNESATTRPPTRTRSVRRWRLPPDEIDLTEADFVIGVGRPVDRSRHLESIQALADRLGATVGGSRVAVFQGTVPRERQIGSSGKWIKPRVYLTLGVSGASYHVMGIKGAKHIIAVNSDPGAPIFKLAELEVVGDFHEVVSALLSAAPAPPPSEGEET